MILYRLLYPSLLFLLSLSVVRFIACGPTFRVGLDKERKQRPNELISSIFNYTSKRSCLKSWKGVMFEVKFGFVLVNSVTLFIVVELSVLLCGFLLTDLKNWHQLLLYPLLTLLAAITPGKYLRKFCRLHFLAWILNQCLPSMLVAWHLVFFNLLGLWISVDHFLGSPFWLKRMLSFDSLGSFRQFGLFHCVQSVYSSSPNLPWGLGHWTPLSWWNSTLKPQTHALLYTAITCREGYLMSASWWTQWVGIGQCFFQFI